MFLKISSSIILSIAAPIIAAGGSSGDFIERSLQSSLACLALNGTVASCCPEGADPNDGVCTGLSCLDGLKIRDGCSCYDIETACEQVATYAPDMCDMVGECCADDGTTTNNVDWDFCMSEAAETTGFVMPDFAALIPGSIPGDLADLGIPGVPTGNAPATDSIPATGSTPTTSSTSPTAVPTNAPPASVPAPSGSSSKYVANATLALICFSLAFLLV